MILQPVSNWGLHLNTYQWSCNEVCRKAVSKPITRYLYQILKTSYSACTLLLPVAEEDYFQKRSVIPVIFRIVEFRVIGYPVNVAEQLCGSVAVHTGLILRLLNDATSQTHALDRPATGIGYNFLSLSVYIVIRIFSQTP
jgi:hypothetical protein